MKKNKRIIIVLLVTLAIGLLVYFTFSSVNNARYQWSEGYKTESDQPYGTQFIKQLLETYRPGEPFIFNDKKPLQELLDSSLREADYIFIGQTLNLDDADQRALLQFIYDGNDALIASVNLPIPLLDHVYINECNRDMFLESHEEQTVSLNFYHDSLRTKYGYTFAYRYGSRELPYYWNALNAEIFCDSTKSIIPLGYQLPDRVNFLKIPYGNGNLYIHCNPLIFTNYFISKPVQTRYAEKVLSHLHGKTIIWDEFSRAAFSGNNADQINPLAYILQQNSLKYAWWMIIGCSLLYTMFAAKRKQRIIPVIEKKINTSLEFIGMISALHFQNGNHLDIAQKKIKYFLYFIRVRYGMHAQPFTEQHVQRLAEKSKMKAVDIQHIFNHFSMMERDPYSSPSADRLVSLYNAIDHFYKHCK